MRPYSFAVMRQDNPDWWDLFDEWQHRRDDFLKNRLSIPSRKDFAKAGVYLLGDFYIGRSQKIHTRIISHISHCFGEVHHNKKLQTLITDKLLNEGKLSVKILSDDPTKEDFFIQQYTLFNFPLVNQLKKIHHVSQL